MAQCRAETQRGGRCQRRAVAGEDGRCASHSGRCGARPGNLNALKHGLYSRHMLPGEQADYALAVEAVGVDDEVAIARLLVLRAVKSEAIEPEAAARVLEALCKVLKTQRLLSGEADDGLAGALGRMLDEVGVELGLE